MVFKFFLSDWEHNSRKRHRLFFSRFSTFSFFSDFPRGFAVLNYTGGKELQPWDKRTTTTTLNKTLNLKERPLHSQLISGISGSFVLFASFCIWQTFGVLLIPITQNTGWNRSTFSVAAGVFQLCRGFLVCCLFCWEKMGIRKNHLFILYILFSRSFILYGSGGSPGLFIRAYGILVGTASG